VLIIRKNGEVERIDTFDLGFMVGLKPDITAFVSQLEVQIQPGDGFVLYTDGITEARNSEEMEYGVERLCETISRHWQYSATEIQKAVIADVRHYVGGQKIHDDLTLLVLKQLPIN
jgi:sigma-B regulation protein RsbU (phosphoserine phosphatase)